MDTLHAIVLRRENSGESDRKLTVLSREEGVVYVIARGARKPSSRLAGSTEPLAISILGVIPGRVNRFVTQAQPVSSFPGLRRDYDRLSYGLALCEVTAGILPHGQESPEEFDLLMKCLKVLEVHETPIVAFLWAQLKLLELAGSLPSWNSCVVSSSKVAEALPFVSPHAGGYVKEEHAAEFTDRFQTRAEVLYGLSALVECDLPPSRMKFSAESARLLAAFWRALIARPVPALEQALQLEVGP